MTEPLLRKVDAVTVRVPNLDDGVAFYGERLGHPLQWRNDDVGQAGLGLPDSAKGRYPRVSPMEPS